jgi:protein arginine kinase activator
MLCQVCENKPATIHITEIADGKKKVLNLCDDCAGEKDLTHGSGAIPNLLAQLVGERKAASDLRCPECGISFEEFRAKGRLGCPKDYEVFEAELAPLLEKIHGAKKHVGRLPGGQPADAGREERLRKLRRELQKAVKAEQFEEAARIRDEIKSAEEALRGAV